VRVEEKQRWMRAFMEALDASLRRCLGTACSGCGGCCGVNGMGRWDVRPRGTRGGCEASVSRESPGGARSDRPLRGVRRRLDLARPQRHPGRVARRAKGASPSAKRRTGGARALRTLLRDLVRQCQDRYRPGPFPAAASGLAPIGSGSWPLAPGRHVPSEGDRTVRQTESPPSVAAEDRVTEDLRHRYDALLGAGAQLFTGCVKTNAICERNRRRLLIEGY